MSTTVYTLIAKQYGFILTNRSDYIELPQLILDLLKNHIIKLFMYKTCLDLIAKQ